MKLVTNLLLSEIFPPYPGGSGRWLWEIYRRLPAPGPVILAQEHPRQEEFDAGHSLRVRRLPLWMPQWGLRSLKALRDYWRNLRAARRAVREYGVREVHCGRCLPEGWVAWLLKKTSGLPYLCFVHGEDVECAAASRELSWMVRRILHGARLLIANSQNTADLLTDTWQASPDKVVVLNPGVDASRFVPAPSDAQARRELGWEGRTVLLTVGRLQKRKGHDMLIRALPRIRQQVPDVLYAVVGRGDERPALDRLIAEHGLGDHVRFLELIDDEQLIRCYQECELFVLPNRQVGRDIEGFGMVLLEAQACGKPVVAGASGGTAETMRVPETGRIVPCEEPGPLAEVLCELLADRDHLARMGQAGRAWVAGKFDWPALCRRAGELLNIPTGGRAASGPSEPLIDEGCLERTP